MRLIGKAFSFEPFGTVAFGVEATVLWCVNGEAFCGSELKQFHRPLLFRGDRQSLDHLGRLRYITDGAGNFISSTPPTTNASYASAPAASRGR